MACCFSNFKQLVRLRAGIHLRPGDIGRYYRTYVELMATGTRCCPKDPERSSMSRCRGPGRQRAPHLDFCGLPFEASCLEFHKTERSIRTAAPSRCGARSSRKASISAALRALAGKVARGPGPWRARSPRRFPTHRERTNDDTPFPHGAGRLGRMHGLSLAAAAASPAAAAAAAVARPAPPAPRTAQSCEHGDKTVVLSAAI